MSIPGQDAVVRFQENEVRFDNFLNDPTSYTTRFAEIVDSLPALAASIASMTLNITLKGTWTTTTAYVRNDVVKQTGVNYICRTSHTSGTFATDLAANKWQVYNQALLTDLADYTSALLGHGMVGYDKALGYHTTRTLAGALGNTAAGYGAKLVGAMGDLTDEIAATLYDIHQDFISVFRWLTETEKADVRSRTGSIDLTLKIQKAINALAFYGAILWFPRGIYLISDPSANTYCLKLTDVIKIKGAGGNGSVLKPNAAISSTTDIIRIFPSTTHATDQMSIEGIFIGDPTNGTCAGRHGIYVLTNTTGQYLPKLRVHGVYHGTSANNGYSFKHLNSSPDAQGAMWQALFDHNQFRSGMWFENSGDSIVIRNNSISGSNIGVYVSQKSGASCMAIENNNIVCTGGAIKSDYASRLSIRHNNIECGGAGSNSSIIDLNGGTSLSYSGVIADNLIGGLAGCTVVNGIRVKNIYGLTIRNNTFLGVSSYNTGILVVDTSVHDLKIHSQTYNAAITTKVSDTGQGTCGVEKTPTLLNSWVAKGSAYSQPFFWKDCEGVVHLNGRIKDGTAAGGTTLFVLPVGFRPTKIERFICYSLGGSVASVGGCEVYDTGEVTISVGGNTEFSFDGISFRALNGADAVSGE